MTSIKTHRNKWLILFLGFLILAVLLVPVLASASTSTVASVNWHDDEVAVNWASRSTLNPLGGSTGGPIEVAVNWASSGTLSGMSITPTVNWGS